MTVNPHAMKRKRPNKHLLLRNITLEREKKNNQGKNINCCCQFLYKLKINIEIEKKFNKNIINRSLSSYPIHLDMHSNGLL